MRTFPLITDRNRCEQNYSDIMIATLCIPRSAKYNYFYDTAESNWTFTKKHG